MDARRFTALVHHLAHGKDRRRFLGQLLGSLAATGLVLRPVETGARKRRKKRRPQPSACARACGSNCNFCVTRATGPMVCGEGMAGGCDLTCTSDFDCLGTGFRYCIATLEEVETGHVSAVCESPGGHCANIQACEV